MPSNLPCSIKGCKNKRYSKGLCQKHKRRLDLYGDPFGGRSFKGDASAFIDGLFGSNEKSTECIIWPYVKNNKGYGTITLNYKTFSVHRIVCERENGKAKQKQVCRHLCGNGHLGCVNPKHLVWGSYKDNSSDAREHNTLAKGEKIANCKTDEKVVRLVRNMKEEGYKNKEIASILGIKTYTVSNIINKRTWAWLT